MLVRLVEVEKGTRGSSTRLKEVYLNPQHIISVADDFQSNQSLISEAENLGLQPNIAFSLVTIQEGTHPRTLTVVGSPGQVYDKIRKRQVLRG
tara:strand:+ start:265 stop:543 length:279 start_codon:yes stop_codon:yes gene_type:complete